MVFLSEKFQISALAYLKSVIKLFNISVVQSKTNENMRKVLVPGEVLTTCNKGSLSVI